MFDIGTLVKIATNPTGPAYIVVDYDVVEHDAVMHSIKMVNSEEIERFWEPNSLIIA
jgi:hypothetical protein